MATQKPDATPPPLKRMTADELQKVPRVSKEALERALEEGERDRAALEANTPRQEPVDPRIRFR